MTESIEVISEYLSLEDCGDNIFYFHISYPKMSRQAIDEWHAAVSSIPNHLAPNEATKIIYDIQKTNFTLTPYLRAKIDDLLTQHQHRVQLVVLITEKTLISQVLKFFLMTFERKNAKTYICFTRDEAFTWLRKNIALLEKS
jgi:hypothetical protein